MATKSTKTEKQGQINRISATVNNITTQPISKRESRHKRQFGNSPIHWKNNDNIQLTPPLPSQRAFHYHRNSVAKMTYFLLSRKHFSPLLSLLAYLALSLLYSVIQSKWHFHFRSHFFSPFFIRVPACVSSTVLWNCIYLNSLIPSSSSVCEFNSTVELHIFELTHSLEFQRV